MMLVPTKGAAILELAHLTGMSVSEIRSISHTPYFDKLYDSLKARHTPRKRHIEKIKSDVDANKLRAMYNNGTSITGLATYFGCSTWTISDLFQQHSIKPKVRGFPKKYVYPSKKELERMYMSDNMTQAEIAKTVGCSDGMIQKIMKEYGITVASPYKVGLTHKDMFREYVVEKLGMAEIAKQHDCSVHAVWCALRKYGIPARPPKRIHLDYEAVKEMRSGRATWETIAKNLGCAASTVKNFYRKERNRKCAMKSYQNS